MQIVMLIALVIAVFQTAKKTARSPQQLFGPSADVKQSVTLIKEDKTLSASQKATEIVNVKEIINKAISDGALLSKS